MARIRGDTRGYFHSARYGLIRQAIALITLTLAVLSAVQASNAAYNDAAWKIQAQFTVSNDPALLQSYDTNQAVLAEALAEKCRVYVTKETGAAVGAGIVKVVPRYATAKYQNVRHYLVDIYLSKGSYRVSRRQMIRATAAIAAGFGIPNRGRQNGRRDVDAQNGVPFSDYVDDPYNRTLIASDSDAASTIETIATIPDASPSLFILNAGGNVKRDGCPFTISDEAWNRIRVAGSPISDFDVTVGCTGNPNINA